MKGTKKLFIWIPVGVAVLILLGWGGYYGYGQWRIHSYKQDIKQPYIRDAETSLGGDTPLEAYKRFRRALEEEQKEKALQYIFLSEREEYRKEFQEKGKAEEYLDMPPAEELQKRKEDPCGREALACHKKAEFYYEYEVKGEKQKYDMGNGITGVKKPGTYKSHIKFIKNLSGKWQISSL